MMKKFIFAVLILALLVGTVSCGSADTSAPAKAAKDFFYEARLDAPVENVEVLSVDMTDDEHAIVKVRVTYGEGMAHMPDQENYKVFLEKYGDEWEVQFTQ
jgi:ABC-type glycerol-3-phosphate transport system substrate-binding protein